MKFVIVAAMLVAVCVAQQPQQVPILRQESELSPEGNFRWSYESGDGTLAQAQGGQKQAGQDVIQEIQGSSAYTSPEGVQIQLNYIANENGFQPQGSHLPTPPPVPEDILRSLEYNAKNPPHPDYTQ